ncbi:hypothetical protein [Maridesulfovibrio bastinii]|uniref:hypothetical protein n=1 Tax=Maridesulfovibrio bastinii TaxID=47157 RepID=UPI000403C776|nr:hypothetical protein [Maridesulfovibrio bastinii]
MKFNFRARVIAITVLCFTVLCSGCEYGSKIWQSAQDSVDPNPEITLSHEGLQNPNDNKLALLFTPVDEQLLKLSSFLSIVDTHPDQEWFKLLFMRYPWISGVMTLNSEAMVLMKLPEDGIKPFKAGPLIEYEGDWSEVRLKSFINYTKFGPELYMATPFFKDAEFKGLVVVHFDPRVLLNFCPRPQDLIIFHPDGGGIWTGMKNLDRKSLLKIKWENLLDEHVRGIIKIGNDDFVWFSRYIGETQIVYLTKAVSKEDDDEFWFF